MSIPNRQSVPWRFPPPNDIAGRSTNVTRIHGTWTPVVKASLSLWLVCPGVSKVFQKENIRSDSEVVIHIFSEHEKHVRKCWSKTFWFTFFAENGPFKDDHWKVSTWSMLMLYENLPARYWSRNLIFWKEESNQTWRNNHSFRLVIFEDGFKSLVWKNYPSENYILGCYPFPGFQSPPWDDIFRVDAVCGTRFNPSWNLWRWRCCAKRHTLR